jgi:putative oxidoreductase
MSLLARVSKLAISPLPAPMAWYAIPLRLIVGFGFMQHGYAKLARGPEDFINVLHAIGVPAAYLLGWATIIVEVIGGFLIPPRRACSSRDDTDGHRPARSDIHGASPEWL